MSFSMSMVKAILETSREPLFNNRYMVSISPKGSLAVSAMGNLEKLGMMASKVTIPGFNIELADFAVGTKNVGVPIQESLEDLSVTFYNTGDEYKSIYGLKNAIYNPLKFTVAYYSDIIVNMAISVYDRANTTVGTYNLQNCVLKSLGSIELSYEEATEVQKFDTTWSCLGMLYN